MPSLATAIAVTRRTHSLASFFVARTEPSNNTLSHRTRSTELMTTMTSGCTKVFSRVYLYAMLAVLLAAAPSRADFNFNDFSDISGLQINGNAAQVGNILRLTPATFFQSGS